MTISLFLECFINGLQTGMLIVLVAYGLVLVLGVGKIFNFAHGEFYMLGAFITYYFGYAILKLNFGICLAVSALGAGLLGWLLYVTIFRKIRRQLQLCTAATIGLSMVFRQAALIGFSDIGEGYALILPRYCYHRRLCNSA